MKNKTLVAVVLFFLGLQVPLCAQEAESQPDRFVYVVGDYLFRAYPVILSSKMSSGFMGGNALIEDCRVFLIDLQEGMYLTEEEREQGYLLKEVPGAEEIVADMRARRERHKQIIEEVTPQRGDEVVVIGEELLGFSAYDTQGKLWNKQEILGRPTVLNFWFVGCGPCVKEMPELNAWTEAYPDVNYLAVTWNIAAEIEPVVSRTPFLFRQLADNRELIRMFAVREFPVTVLIDKHGVIQRVVTGTRPEDKQHFVDHLKELLGR